ncbi:MAG: ABC transporter permease [Acidobacteriota bacterium]|jgi:predicted permease
MRAIRVFLCRLGGLFNNQRKDRELAEEIESHLGMHIEDNIHSGMTPEQARRDALIKSGGLELAKEAYRDRRSFPVLETAMCDLRHSLRVLRRSPVFTTVAVLLLALGIGANTAIFTLLDQLMLRLLPVKDPEQLVMIWTTGPNLGSNQGSRSSSYPMYQDFQQRAQVFSYVFCRYYTPLSISLGSETERVMGELVSGNYFQALGVGPAVGRVFSPEEDDRVYQGHPVVVLSHQYWVTRFAADPGVVGKKVLVNNYPMIIVGVSAAGFSGIDPTRSPQIRVPMQMKPLMTPGSDQLGNRRNQWVQIFARLGSGHTMLSAQASLQPLLSEILLSEVVEPALRDFPQNIRDRFLARKVRVESAANGYSDLRQSYSGALTLLMSMVGLVLMIACFNVASLLIARAAARQKEVAVRLAVGASRGQLIRQLFIESTVLSVAGGAIGLFLSVAMTRTLLRFLPTRGMLLAMQAEPDWRILVFSLALAFITAILFGLAPAWQSVRVDLSSTLKGAEGAIAGCAGSARLRKSLVTAQVAFSFLLLVGAGLFVKTLANLRQTNPGFRDIDNLITFQVDPARSGYSLQRLKDFYRQVRENVQSLPGVKSVGYAWIPVLSGREADWDFVVEGHPAKDGDTKQAFVNCLSPGYWRTMGVALSDGRDFDARDEGRRYQVAIVNRAFADRFFGDRSPIGRHIGFDGPGAIPDIEIVGLVENSLNEGPREGVRCQVFLPLAQSVFPYAATFYVRTSAGSAAMYTTLRRKLQEMDPALPLYEMKTLKNQLDETLGTERLTAMLSTAFGVLATTLCAIGLYGVIALLVVRRTKEIGLRMALGAPQGVVFWLVMKEALGVLAVGLAVGIPCAFWLSRYVSSQLFGVAPTDIRTAVTASVVLVAVTVSACVLPARRASLIDPIQALRHE